MKTDANNSLFQHEFGHYIDSQIFGLSYLIGVGIPSAISARKARPIEGEEYTNTHSFHRVEIRANRRAAKYFKKHYGIDWNNFENEYPRRIRN